VLKVAVIGATGYTGEELVKILVKHKSVKLTCLQAILEKETSIANIFPSLTGKIDLVCEKPNIKKALKEADLFFLALPHTVSMKIAPEFLKEGKAVIDLSADYRLEVSEYEKWYGTTHVDKNNIKKAVYGLPELFEESIKKTRFIANPGCYPTGAILAVSPLVKSGLVNLDTIIVDSKSGATGAGRKASIALCFSEVNESLKAYKINEHQHKPEIESVISKVAGKNVEVVFAPHLIPMNRGILTTVYMDLNKNIDTKKAVKLYKDFYRGKAFVNVLDEGNLPAIRDVQYTNACNIGVKVTGNKIVVVSCIDNLLKGAAGQAVQNMNIMYGFSEKEGLD